MKRLISLALGVLLLPSFGHAQPSRPIQSILERRHETVILQQFDISCGAAALATLLRYQHGEHVSERDVAIGLISRDVYIADPGLLRRRQGFSLLDMNRYVRQLGYDPVALGKVGYEDLAELAPAIVPIQVLGYSHFVVFRGALGDNVLLADPAYGNRTMPRERFISAWIEYAELGKVAFAVRRRDGLIPPNRLAVSSDDFPVLN